MISDIAPSRQVPQMKSKTLGSEGSYVDWAAIIAGAVFALALSFLLLSFGASLGLSLASPYRGEGVSAAWLAIAAGIWFAWVMVTGFGAGGYLAGRMRRRAGDATPGEVEVRDGTHGLLVWATGALVSTILAASGVGGALAVGTAAVGTVAQVAADAASTGYFADLVLRGEAEDLQAGAVTPQANDANGFSGTEPAIRQEIVGIIARSATVGEMAERDRAYLAQIVADNSALDPTAARARVDAVNAEIDAARATALAAVEKARIGGVVFGFIAAATMLIGAVAACFAAAAGGRHRDEGLGFDALTARR